jgi:hypothetical protein
VAGDLDAVIQYRLTGEEAGDYVDTLHDGKCTVTEGEASNPSVSLSAVGRDFAVVLLGRAIGLQYFMTG